jgi:hypothetical protein
MEIVWGKGYVRIEGSEPIRWKTPAFGELRAFAYGLERAAEVFRLLEAARDAYEGGRAKYENATEEIKHLIDEANAAAGELVAASRRVGEWFPDLDLALFRGQGDDLLEFCRAWIEKVGHPPEVRGNLSRGRSARSRTTPPETVASVNGSSQAAAEPSGGLGSSRATG